MNKMPRRPVPRYAILIPDYMSHPKLDEVIDDALSHGVVIPDDVKRGTLKVKREWLNAKRQEHYDTPIKIPIKMPIKKDHLFSIPAAEVNERLRNMPPVPLYGEEEE